MSHLLGSYDPTKLIVTVGTVIVSGFSDGDSITVRRDEDNYFKRIGTDGNVARARNANKSGSLEIRLLQTSGANDELSILFNFDDLDSDGVTVVPLSVIDGSGRTLCVATQAWIRTPPEVVFSKEVAERVWTIDCADLKLYVGGNPT